MGELTALPQSCSWGPISKNKDWRGREGEEGRRRADGGKGKLRVKRRKKILIIIIIIVLYPCRQLAADPQGCPAGSQLQMIGWHLNL